MPRVLEGGAPRRRWTVRRSALFGPVGAVVTGRAGRALPALADGLLPGFSLGVIAGLFVYALTPADWARDARSDGNAARDSAHGG